MRSLEEELCHECAELIEALSPGLTAEEVELLIEEHESMRPEHRTIERPNEREI